jgi:hypothetical protein
MTQLDSLTPIAMCDRIKEIDILASRTEAEGSLLRNFIESLGAEETFRGISQPHP